MLICFIELPLLGSMQVQNMSGKKNLRFQNDKMPAMLTCVTPCCNKSKSLDFELDGLAIYLFVCLFDSLCQ